MRGGMACSRALRRRGCGEAGVFETYMLQCRSKAFTRASNLWLLRTLMSTCELFLTLCFSTDSGPVSNWSLSSSFFSALAISRSA